jgi:glycerol-3-phosphate acyltransferase PlsY
MGLYFVKMLLLPVFAYLLGSVPFGLIITKLFLSEDIRKAGSGNIGATNVRRMAGNIPGILTLFCDVGKGAFPVYLSSALVVSESFSSPDSWAQLYIAITALSAFAGHLFPVYTGFKGGGKGVATAGGCFLFLSPFSLFVAVLVFILAVNLSNRASVGSLAGSLILPLAVWKASGSAILTGCAGVMTIGIFLRHHENIRRLIAGTEPTL